MNNYVNKNCSQNPSANEHLNLPDVNRVIITGRLLFDPPIRWTKKDVPVTNFVITTQPDKDIYEPVELRTQKCFVNIVVWARKALFCYEHLKKNIPVVIIGELQSMQIFAPERAFYPVQIRARWIQILEKKALRL